MEANNLTKHLHPVRDANGRAHINPGKKIHGNAQIISSVGCRIRIVRYLAAAHVMEPIALPRLEI
jgi:hypothetical protein